MHDLMMSVCKNHLVSLLLKEIYGEVVGNIGMLLMRKGYTSIKPICTETGLQLDQVKKALRSMIEHHLVGFEVNKLGVVEYGCNGREILLHMRFPRYIYTAKTLFGDCAELLCEEMLQHGRIQMSKVIVKVAERLNQTLQDESPVTLQEVKDKFTSLVQTRLVLRCPAVVPPDTEVEPAAPIFTISDQYAYEIPHIDVSDIERVKIRDYGDSEPPLKRIKRDDDVAEAGSSCMPDSDIYWRVNYDRFDQYLRDQAIINATSNKLDKKAGEVLRTILRVSEVKTDSTASVTTPVSYNEIYQQLPKEMGIGKHLLDQYLKLLVNDTNEFLLKAGDSGGGMYSVHFQRAFSSLCKAHIESVIQERFGSKCLRLYRLLILKNQIEQKQIEEFSMIPAKEAKQMLYRMFGEHLLSLTEVPKTPDHAPSRTYYLFSININQVARMLLERCYKTAGNVICRRHYETKENKRLLDKQQRLEAIVASLEQSGADTTQKAEIEEMITPSERNQLNKVKRMTNKLEQCELQLDDTIFSMETFLLYAHSK